MNVLVLSLPTASRVMAAGGRMHCVGSSGMGVVHATKKMLACIWMWSWVFLTIFMFCAAGVPCQTALRPFSPFLTSPTIVTGTKVGPFGVGSHI